MKHLKHIVISDKFLCSGCSACSAVCPKACITMRKDDMGSSYPMVDTAKCIECGTCVRVCPFLNPAAEVAPTRCFAAANRDNSVRLKSSSGGVFHALAQRVVSSGGVVVGAVFCKDWMVEHISVESMDGVARMMGSKYTQSDTLATFAETRKHLLSGRTVLYTGTPCQIAGLNHFLRKDFSNLITVEVICHGAPERGVWRDYLKELLARPTGECAGEKTVLRPPLKEQDVVIDDIAFRDKRNGWKKYGFALFPAYAYGGRENTVLRSTIDSFYEPFQDNAYMTAFLRNYSLRPSCYSCRAKSGRSHADLTIGDFWGIGCTDIISDDDKGVSAVVCRSDKGLAVVRQCAGVELVECLYADILKSNPSMEQSVTYTDNARLFHKLFPKQGFYKTLHSIEHPTLFRRVKLSLKYRIKILLKKISVRRISRQSSLHK